MAALTGPPRVTVVIPTHDRAAMLPRAVDSALAQEARQMGQTRPGADFQVLVADDGSTDGTDQVLERYAGNPRVRVLKLPHGGVSRARNAAVAASDSPLIAFLDSDDEWLPGKLAAQTALLERSGLEICQTEEIWVRNGVRVNPPAHYVKREGELFALSLNHCMITPSSVLMTRSLFQRVGGFNPEFPACEDFELWLRITRDQPVGLIRQPMMIRYGGHADQLSTRFAAQDRFRIRGIALLLQGNGLSASQRSLARSALEAKLGIFQTGCQKRGKIEEVAWCDAIRARYL